jgi:hypothetical protein
LSTQCEFRSRLTRRATQGTSKRWRIGIAFSWVTFFLAKKKKVTSYRATPRQTGTVLLTDQFLVSEKMTLAWYFTMPHLNPLIPFVSVQMNLLI